VIGSTAAGDKLKERVNMPIEFLFGSNDPRADEAEFVVCRRAEPDGERPEGMTVGVCSNGCGTEIQWTADAPDRPKICFACMASKVADVMIERTKEALSFKPSVDVAFMEDMVAKVGLTKTPEAIQEVLDVGDGKVPQPGEPHYAAFREGTAFAMSMILNVFMEEQKRGALVDLPKRHHETVGVMIWLVDSAIDKALKTGRFAEPEKETADAEEATGAA
jgi:hypothetical protein